jgi:hypothetical protein
MIEARMPDGTVLQFPAQTADDVVDRAAREYIATLPPPPSVGRSIGLGTRATAQGLAAIPGALYDAAGGLINMGAAGLEAIGGPSLPRVRTASENIGSVADAAGLPQPATPGERIMSRGVQELAGLATTGGAGAALRGAQGVAGGVGSALTAAPVTQAFGAAGAGLAGGAAQEAGYGMAGELAAGLSGGVAGSLVPAAGRLSSALVQGMAQPFMAGGRDRIVGEALLRNSADPQNLPVRLRAGIADVDARLPNAPFTTAQAARDPGLAVLESGVRNMPADPAGGVTAYNPGAALRDVEARRDAARAEFMGARVPGYGPDISGDVIRGILAEQRGQRNVAVSNAYNAVDPDGTARLPIQPILQALDEDLGKYFGAGTLGPPRELVRLRDVIAGLGDDGSYNALQGTYSELVDIASRAEAQGQPRVLAVATRAKQAIDRAAATAAEPRRLPGQQVGLSELDAQDAARGAVARPDIAYAEQVRAPQNGEKSLVQFLVEQGGLRPSRGDLSAVMGGAFTRRPGLANNRGRPLDLAAMEARSAGYFPEHMDGMRPDRVDTLTQNDLLNAIEAELSGGAVRYPGGGVRREAAGLDSGLRRNIEREMDQRGLSGVQGPELLRAVRDDVELPAAGMDRPDGTVQLQDGMTAEQAQRWRDARDMRTQVGLDFGRDQAAAGGVAQALRGGDRPTMRAENVPASLMRSVPDVEQALRAAGPNEAQVREALGNEWLRGLQASMTGTRETLDAAGNAVQGTLAGKARRYIADNVEVARRVLTPSQMADVLRLTRDLSETAATAGAAAARGSNTAQNLALGNLMARLGAEPSERLGIGAQGVMAGVGGLAGMLLGGQFGAGLGAVAGGAAPAVLRRAYAAPERAMREQLARAMVEPSLAAQLLAALPPAGQQRGAMRTPDYAAEARAMIARQLALGANATAQSRQ